MNAGRDERDDSDRLEGALVEYLEALESGVAPNRAELLRRYPELAGELADYFATRDRVREALTPLKTVVHVASPRDPSQTSTVGLPDRPTKIPASEFFGEYQLLEEIGRGGMGVVYKAHQTDLDRTVAVKVILSGAFASAEDVARFRAGAEAAARLQHPYICNIHEAGSRDGHEFVSMDYVEGRTLAEIARRDPPSAKQAAEFVLQIAQAVQYAHEQGVVHRDLKPSNVIVDADGNVRIIDFGLARRIDVARDLTTTGQVLGTAGYMPPEQAAGHSDGIGPHSDVYSLGAILYEMLTGRPPFRAESTLDTLLQVLEDEPVAPRVLNPNVPRDLESVCLKCLVKEPQRRFGSARELADDLHRFLEDHPTMTRPIGRLGRYVRWCRRKPIAAGFLATAVILLLLAVVASGSIAQHLEARLRQEVRRHNAYAALNVADNVVGQLQRWSAPVTVIAGDAELRSLLAGEASADALQTYVQGVHRNFERQFESEGEKAPYSNWFVMDPAGIALARSPEPAGFVGRNYAWRDYFAGAIANARRSDRVAPHVSRVYLSDSDHLYKFAISAAVRAEDHRDAPVLGVVVATIATNSTFGLPHLNDAQRHAVLIGLADRRTPDESPGALYRILVHDAYDTPGERADPAPHRSLADLHASRDARRSELARRRARPDHIPTDDDYVDPVEGGRWLAAFAPVGNTEFVIVVEQRYESAVSWRWIVLELGVWLTIAATIVAVVMGAAAWLSARRARSHRRHQRELQPALPQPAGPESRSRSSQSLSAIAGSTRGRR